MNLTSLATESKTAREITITVFPRLPARECGGRSCSCSPTSASPSANLDLLLSRLDQLKPRFGDRLRVEVMEYTTTSEIQQAIEKLNLALRASNSNYVVSPQNLTMLLTAAAPVVIVNNVIIASGDLSAAQILNHIETL